MNFGVQSLGREDPLEKGMATHSSILAWRIPWTEEPGGLQSIGSERVRHDQETNTHTHTRTHTHFRFSSLNIKDAAVHCYVWCSCNVHTLSCPPLKWHRGLAVVCAKPAPGWPRTGPQGDQGLGSSTLPWDGPLIQRWLAYPQIYSYQSYLIL